MPDFGADIFTFTLKTQRELYYKSFEDRTPQPGKAALDQARVLFDAMPTEDFWASQYKFRGRPDPPRPRSHPQQLGAGHR
ncbi:hypothetical protein ACQEVM_17580 [Streptomyces sp. CA-243310]|uniref:hypothetical protein n=1 Tax=Streptomyces sp. CA-243310 TaxID=3240056 RepID=UPI003D90AA0F